MFSKGVEFTFEFDPSDDEVRRTIRDSRCMLKCDACGDAAVVAAARALAAAYDAALAAEVRADARARDAAPAEGAWFWRSFCAPYGAAPAPAPLYLFVRPSRVRDRDRLFVVLAGATLVVTYRRDGDDAGPVAETCVEGYAPGAGGWIGAAARTVDRVPADDAARAAAAAFLAALPARGDAGADLQLLCHAYLHRRDSAHLGDVFARHALPPRPRTDPRPRARGLLGVDGRPLEVAPATGAVVAGILPTCLCARRDDRAFWRDVHNTLETIYSRHGRMIVYAT